MALTPEQVRFHNTTAINISNFLQFNKLPSSTINDFSFLKLLQHLNPLVQVPKIEKIDAYFKSKGPLERYQCIICETNMYEGTNFVAGEDAALYLTIAVMAGMKSLQKAKRNILNQYLVVCADHVDSFFKSILQSVGMANITYFDDIPDELFLSGRTIYNKIKNMWQVFNDMPLAVIQEGEFIKLMKEWLLRNLSAQNNQRKIGGFAAHRNTIDSDINNARNRKTVEERIAERTEENAEQVKEIKLEEPDIENIKLEEPDDVQVNDYSNPPITQEPSTSSAPVLSNSSSPLPTPAIPASPSSLSSVNRTIYTLPNGKKVMKFPSELAGAAFANSAGKLVVHLLPTRKLYKRAVEHTDDMTHQVSRIS